MPANPPLVAMRHRGLVPCESVADLAASRTAPGDGWLVLKSGASALGLTPLWLLGCHVSAIALHVGMSADSPGAATVEQPSMSAWLGAVARGVAPGP